MAEQKSRGAGVGSSVVWHSPVLQSSEHCSLTRTPGGHRLSGTVVLPVEGRPGLIRYSVEVDSDWRTRRVEAVVGEDGSDRRIEMVADGEGDWLVDGEPAPLLDGCLDIDLGWSPSTNTLPIRRLGLKVGESAEIRAAWVRFPEFDLRPAGQRYDRLDRRRWQYSSGSFEAILEVDADGLVLSYGPGLWEAVAHSSGSDGTHRS